MSSPVQVDVEKNSPSDDRINQVRQQVNEVKNIMSDNVVRIMERGERLDDLDTRTEALHASSQNFQTTARQVHRKMWFKNLKWTIIMGVVILLVIALIVILILNGSGAIKFSHCGFKSLILYSHSFLTNWIFSYSCSYPSRNFTENVYYFNNYSRSIQILNSKFFK
uniref:V-SNARE coiled-coil homology domain-containing protein n=1 Tax=Panagrolaimus sp. JU765 TaxID=591449 RepID=A0AC34QKE0_9BILA